MLRFYPGLTLDSISRIDSEFAEQMWQAITVIEAQEALVACKISDFPYMKENTRRKFMKDLNRAASPVILKTAPVAMTAKDFAEMING